MYTRLKVRELGRVRFLAQSKRLICAVLTQLLDFENKLLLGQVNWGQTLREIRTKKTQCTSGWCADYVAIETGAKNVIFKY